MLFEDMKAGLRYIVTTASLDGTFEVGDHIRLYGDGSITCLEAQGWITAHEVQEAIKGVEVKLDVELLQYKERQLQAELAELQALEDNNVAYPDE